MELNIRSKDKRKRDNEKKLGSWHRKFAIWPLRIDDETVIFLTSYYRKTPMQHFRNDPKFTYMTVEDHAKQLISVLKNEELP